MSFKEEIKRVFQTPHCKTLNLELVSTGKSTVTLKLPFNDKLIGDPDKRYLHGGVITTLIDTACGCAIFQTQANFRAMATLDLRVDYMRPALPDHDIFAFADCYYMTDTIAFVRVTAFCDDSKRPVASAMATFKRSSKEFPQ